MNKSLQHQNNTQHPPWRQPAQTCQDINIFSNFAFVLQFVKFSYNAHKTQTLTLWWGFGNSLLIVHLEFDALLMFEWNIFSPLCRPGYAIQPVSCSDKLCVD